MYLFNHREYDLGPEQELTLDEALSVLRFAKIGRTPTREPSVFDFGSIVWGRAAKHGGLRFEPPVSGRADRAPAERTPLP